MVRRPFELVPRRGALGVHDLLFESELFEQEPPPPVVVVVVVVPSVVLLVRVVVRTLELCRVTSLPMLLERLPSMARILRRPVRTLRTRVARRLPSPLRLVPRVLSLAPRVLSLVRTARTLLTVLWLSPPTPLMQRVPVMSLLNELEVSSSDRTPALLDPQSVVM